jgi:site-specific DNA-methyltransferase (adenine-specific)/site-specific DNA-methyltransferase (cytosine-N4-specific)
LKRYELGGSVAVRKNVEVFNDQKKNSHQERVAVVGQNYSDQGADSQIIVGDALEILKEIPDERFRCCVTSPPYWGLRDYGIPSQIGAEEELEDYIGKLVLVFNQVQRTLTRDGTLWLNIGDSYTSGNRTWRDSDKKNPARAMNYRPPTPGGLKPKDLVGIPWRLAFALQAEGWYLRSDIIWYKPNCQPESVKDRPTQAHEYLFLFSKSEKYYYDYEAVKESSKTNGTLRNRRTVWSINTEAFPDAHFAVFPTKLVEPCLLAGSEPNDVVLDPFLGSGTVGEVCLGLNRRFVGIELNPEYIEIATKRIKRGLELRYEQRSFLSDIGA